MPFACNYTTAGPVEEEETRAVIETCWKAAGMVSARVLVGMLRSRVTQPCLAHSCSYTLTCCSPSTTTGHPNTPLQCYSCLFLSGTLPLTMPHGREIERNPLTLTPVGKYCSILKQVHPYWNATVRVNNGSSQHNDIHSTQHCNSCLDASVRASSRGAGL